MSASTSIKLEETKSQLEARLQQLLRRAKEIEEDLSAKPDASWDENAIDSENDEVLVRLAEKTDRDITSVRQALKQITLGIYGICSRCGNSIDAERLECLPQTSRCSNCA